MPWYVSLAWNSGVYVCGKACPLNVIGRFAGDGYVVIGSEDGQLRLYSDRSLSRANTAVPGLGAPITSVDVTFDGKWVLATTDKYLMVVKTTYKVIHNVPHRVAARSDNSPCLSHSCVTPLAHLRVRTQASALAGVRACVRL